MLQIVQELVPRHRLLEHAEQSFAQNTRLQRKGIAQTTNQGGTVLFIDSNTFTQTVAIPTRFIFKHIYQRQMSTSKPASIALNSMWVSGTQHSFALNRANSKTHHPVCSDNEPSNSSMNQLFCKWLSSSFSLSTNESVQAPARPTMPQFSNRHCQLWIKFNTTPLDSNDSTINSRDAFTVDEWINSTIEFATNDSLHWVSPHLARRRQLAITKYCVRLQKNAICSAPPQYTWNPSWTCKNHPLQLKLNTFFFFSDNFDNEMMSKLNVDCKSKKNAHRIEPQTLRSMQTNLCLAWIKNFTKILLIMDQNHGFSVFLALFRARW